MLHPGLAKGDQLRTGEAEAPPIKAVDRNGAALTPEAHPALAGVLDSLRDKYGDKTDGKPGVELFIHRAKSAKPADQLPDKTLKVLSKGTPGTLKTTLDARLQAAAERRSRARSPPPWPRSSPAPARSWRSPTPRRRASTWRPRARSRPARR